MVESAKKRLNMVNTDCRTLNFSSVDRQSANVGFLLYIASWSIVCLFLQDGAWNFFHKSRLGFEFLVCRFILNISENSVAWQGTVLSGLLNGVCRCIKKYNSNGLCFIAVCTGEANDQPSRGPPETTVCSERRDWISARNYCNNQRVSCILKQILFIYAYEKFFHLLSLLVYRKPTVANQRGAPILLTNHVQAEASRVSFSRVFFSTSLAKGVNIAIATRLCF